MDLSALGLELDNVRRARRGEQPHDDGCAPLAGSPGAAPDQADSPQSTSSLSTTPSPVLSTSALPPPADQERPYPLCLLCLTRPPSAVLLPCAHLNLCHLCAPLLMHKAARACPAAPPAEPELDPRRDGRVPYHVALSRALASRRRSIGSSTAFGSTSFYEAPRAGVRGGEMRGSDLLPPPGPPGTVAGTATDESGLARAYAAAGGGEVRLALDGQRAAQCLVCRAGVSGWLRVYTG